MKKKWWILILAIIAAAALVTVGIILLPDWNAPDSEQPGQSATGEEESPTEGVTRPGDNKVTFYANDGSVLKIDYVDDGEAATPPKQPQMLYGGVFCSWDTEFTQVQNDLQIRPVWEDVREKVNVLAVEGAYGFSGGTVMVPVRLCGQVCVAGLDMTVTYDPEALELLSVTEDGAVIYNDQKPGTIRLNYVSGENTEADVDLCFLEFAIKSQPGEQPITLEIHDIYAFQEKMESNVDTMYRPECTVMNGTVYIMQGGMIIEES